MEDNKQSLFRKKSLENIESPDLLDNYLRVTSPGVWMLITAIVVILIGTVIWGFLGHIDSRLNVAVCVTDGAGYCLVPEKALEQTADHLYVAIDEKEYELSPNAVEPISVTENMNVYIRMAGDLNMGDIVYPVPITDSLPDGVYTGSILLERITPISFLLN